MRSAFSANAEDLDSERAVAIGREHKVDLVFVGNSARSQNGRHPQESAAAVHQGALLWRLASRPARFSQLRQETAHDVRVRILCGDCSKLPFRIVDQAGVRVQNAANDV